MTIFLWINGIKVELHSQPAEKKGTKKEAGNSELGSKWQGCGLGNARQNCDLRNKNVNA